MKKVLFILTALLVISCSPDDSPSYHYVILPVETFEVPETVQTGQIYQIKVSYKRPTTCHVFEGFYYDMYFEFRTIGVQNIVVDRNDCIDTDPDEEAIVKSFDFSPTEFAPYTYIFRFYKGKDEQGNNIFEEVEIPVE
ncbi:hypothetical protein [Flavobacterium orientale]|uniref:Uncharacterized protein n=1 Tax=Flavobacterium orientale TaxID=1756020 RepID=A0A917DAK4_9FLAO|nr:hypothetical protein [Flavobacterium orientale]GGD23112.1 hypothetical protein GCM10011343_11630 [Flavobacterium orientale]